MLLLSSQCVCCETPLLVPLFLLSACLQGTAVKHLTALSPVQFHEAACINNTCAQIPSSL